MIDLLCEIQVFVVSSRSMPSSQNHVGAAGGPTPSPLTCLFTLTCPFPRPNTCFHVEVALTPAGPARPCIHVHACVFIRLLTSVQARVPWMTLLNPPRS